MDTLLENVEVQMELRGNQNLGRLLRAALAGEIAIFASFLDSEDGEIAELNHSPTADSRGRKIYEVFELLNPPEDEEDDLELCTDLHFHTDAVDLELEPGAIIEREVDHALFGSITMKLVKLTPQDADFLLGTLPDGILDQVAVYAAAEE